MINKVNLEIDKFVMNAEEIWVELHEGNSKKANNLELANRKIVNEWTKNGVALEVLSPLLTHSSSAVKLAAAGYLIKSEAKDQAVLVLRNLIQGDSGLIAPMAAAVLRVNKISNLH